jgi:NADPH:quinone reductase
MKAIRIHSAGGPEVYRYEEVPDAVAGPGQVLVRIAAAGINYSDVGARRNAEPDTLPVIAGSEAAGTVVAVGDGVTNVGIGAMVAFQPVPGCYADMVAAPASQVVEVPVGIKPEAAAASMLQGRTAYAMAFHAYPIKTGDRVLVQAGAGGVGLLLTQLAKMAGAYVFSTVGSDEKREAAHEAGADTVINYSTEDFEAAVMRATGGEGVSAVYDAVGQTTFLKGISCLARNGVMVSYGRASGPIEPFDLSLLGRVGGFVTSTAARHHAPTDEERHRQASLVLQWVQEEKLKLRYTAYPLAQAADAHRDLEGRKSIGKLLLIP